MNDREQKLKNLISSVDIVLTKFRQEIYYSPPKYHTSIASMLGDQNRTRKPGITDQVRNISDDVITVRRDYDVPFDFMGYSMCKTIENENKSCLVSEGIEESDNEVEEMIWKKKKTITDPNSCDQSDIFSYCFYEVYCKIGDRIFVLKLNEENTGSKNEGFQEVR